MSKSKELFFELQIMSDQTEEINPELVYFNPKTSNLKNNMVTPNITLKCVKIKNK
jgi:hypothetical protein